MTRITWKTEVTETRTREIEPSQIPDAVQYALDNGFEWGEILTGGTTQTLSERGQEVFDAAHEAIEDFLADLEDAQDDDEAAVTERYATHVDGNEV